jgi:hypothetical protein
MPWSWGGLHVSTYKKNNINLLRTKGTIWKWSRPRCFSLLNYSYLVSTYKSTSVRKFFFGWTYFTTSLHNENQTQPNTHHNNKQYAQTITQGTPIQMAKGQKKRSASNGGNTVDKNHKRSSAEGDDDGNEDAGTKGLPGCWRKALGLIPRPAFIRWLTLVSTRPTRPNRLEVTFT